MRMTLIGTGLIGGSAAWAMKERSLIDEVVAYDHHIANAERAVAIGFADVATDNIATAVAAADCVMVAVPVQAMAEVFGQVGRHARPGTFITDVGSVRGSVIAAARAALGEHFSGYAPVHPIAGGEMPGVAYATPSLFVGCKAISTPEDGMSLVAVDYWESVWQEIGARIYRMTPAEHDDIFAQVSHLPHVLAYALVDAMARSEGAATKFSFVGAGFRDFTRIAASSPKMWRDICLANRDAILASIAMFEGGLAALREAIEKGDGDALQASFERACQARRTVSTRPAPSRAGLAK